MGPWSSPASSLRQLGNTGKRLPALCLPVSPYLTAGVIMVRGPHRAPQEAAPSTGAAQGQLWGPAPWMWRADHRGGISQGIDIILCHLPGTALPGDGRVHAQGSLLKGDLTIPSDTLPQRACVQSQIRLGFSLLAVNRDGNVGPVFCCGEKLLPLCFFRTTF